MSPLPRQLEPDWSGQTLADLHFWSQEYGAMSTNYLVQLRLAMRLQDTVHISLNNNSKYSIVIKHLTYNEQQTAPTCKGSHTSSCRDNWC